MSPFSFPPEIDQDKKALRLFGIGVSQSEPVRLDNGFANAYLRTVLARHAPQNGSWHHPLSSMFLPPSFLLFECLDWAWDWWNQLMETIVNIPRHLHE